MHLFAFLAVVVLSGCGGAAASSGLVTVQVACEGDSQVVSLELEPGEDLTLKTGTTDDCPDCNRLCAVHVTHE